MGTGQAEDPWTRRLLVRTATATASPMAARALALLPTASLGTAIATSSCSAPHRLIRLKAAFPLKGQAGKNYPPLKGQVVKTKLGILTSRPP